MQGSVEGGVLTVRVHAEDEISRLLHILILTVPEHQPFLVFPTVVLSDAQPLAGKEVAIQLKFDQVPIIPVARSGSLNGSTQVEISNEVTVPYGAVN